MLNFGIAIWGAGKRGREILGRIGENNVDVFIDQDENKQGSLIDGIRISSFSEFQQRFSPKSLIIISPVLGIKTIEEQLDQSGYHHYVEYSQLFGGRDFSLKSGERQTGTNLDDIRFDHLCRYQLVDKYLENADKCLVNCKEKEIKKRRIFLHKEMLQKLIAEQVRKGEILMKYPDMRFSNMIQVKKRIADQQCCGERIMALLKEG